jgi:hypothetical protein
LGLVTTNIFDIIEINNNLLTGLKI